MKLTVARLGHLGDGIAEGPEGPVFIPRTLPAEVVEGTLLGERLEQVRIVSPVSDRVKPPCVHARTCGGCIMQHASDPLVAGWKEGIVEGALAGQGLRAPIRPILTSPAQSRRRATLSARRTRAGALLGFHMRGSETILPVPHCQLLDPALVAAFPALEAIVRLGGTRASEMQLTITRSAAGPDVTVSGAKQPDAELRLNLARLAETYGFSRLTWGDETVALRAPPSVKFGPAMVTPPPGAFLQATDHGEASLVAAVTEAVGPAGKVADLFAGCGTFSLPLTRQAEVLAVEGDAAMTAAMVKGWRGVQGLRRLTAETRDLFRRPLEPDELKGLDAVVIDPPRAGAEAQTGAIARAGVPVVVMVSCNPATFARDARILVAAGYRIDWIQPVDQFRWSAHVELAARLSR